MKEVNPFNSFALCLCQSFLIAWHTEWQCPGGALLCESAFWNISNVILGTCKSLPFWAGKMRWCYGRSWAVSQPLVGRGWCFCAHKCRDIEKRAKQIIREIPLREGRHSKVRKEQRRWGELRYENRRCWAMAVQLRKTSWTEQWTPSTRVFCNSENPYSDRAWWKLFGLSPFLSEFMEKEEVKWNTRVKWAHFAWCILVF